MGRSGRFKAGNGVLAHGAEAGVDIFVGNASLRGGKVILDGRGKVQRRQCGIGLDVPGLEAGEQLRRQFEQPQPVSERPGRYPQPFRQGVHVGPGLLQGPDHFGLCGRVGVTGKVSDQPRFGRLRVRGGHDNCRDVCPFVVLVDLADGGNPAEAVNHGIRGPGPGVNRPQDHGNLFSVVFD